MGIFGNFFDFDGDGKASMFEELLGLDALGFFDTKDEDDDSDEEDWDSEEDENNI